MKRKQYSNEFKMQVVKEALESGNRAAVARRYELHYNVVQRWMKDADAGKFEDFNMAVVDDAGSKALVKENDQLKRLLGEKDLEIAILRDLIKKKNPHLLKSLK
ncbi:MULTISPECIES: transposase [Brevibacillus]|uniref:Transposase n=5 Tax=Brevibacillus invocatus TaxID=173959 RepID=A0A3M8BS47_9BACL|nr:MULTISPECIES: transposase [Brevibacillus]EAO7496401.1 transposase [Salmonella enterica]HAJ4019676.1 transposase [Escherichia coli]EAO9488546.1 transposase [Salmonella enterica]EJL39831.1 transposase [Brevibacillus sp. CF112]MBG9566321.1 transposase [Brevibacillus agri]